jgi:uncharacterized membrane protein
MANLLAAAAAFVLLHRAISGSSLRGVIVKRTGEAAYGGLFGLATLAILIWLGMAYATATTPYAVATLWNPHQLARDLQVVVQALAILLVVTGLTTPNPTTFRQEAVVDQADSVRGILRVTRHPFLWGVALLAIGHIAAAPSVRNLILFGALLFVSLTGTFSIDAKRKRSLGSRWKSFADQTSNVPFVAIATGRQRLRPGEIGWKKVGLAIGISAALTVAHPFLFDTSAIRQPPVHRI